MAVLDLIKNSQQSLDVRVASDRMLVGVLGWIVAFEFLKLFYDLQLVHVVCIFGCFLPRRRLD